MAFLSIFSSSVPYRLIHFPFCLSFWRILQKINVYFAYNNNHKRQSFLMSLLLELFFQFLPLAQKKKPLRFVYTSVLSDSANIFIPASRRMFEVAESAWNVPSLEVIASANLFLIFALWKSLTRRVIICWLGSLRQIKISNCEYLKNRPVGLRGLVKAFLKVEFADWSPSKLLFLCQTQF